MQDFQRCNCFGSVEIGGQKQRICQQNGPPFKRKPDKMKEGFLSDQISCGILSPFVVGVTRFVSHLQVAVLGNLLNNGGLNYESR